VGDAAPVTVESAFHVYLSRLRRLLEMARGSGVLVRQAHGYRLRVELEQLDATRFDHLVSEGSEALAAGKAELAADSFRQALALWRGLPLADLQSERFVVPVRARLEEERVAALEQRLEADLLLGRHHELIGELGSLVSEHPYRERLREQLMLALYRSGRQAEALRAYQEARRTLADELGLEPSRQLRELEQAMLRQDDRLTFQPSKRPHAEPEAPLRRSSFPPARYERKVVTVLFADPVGSTDGPATVDPEDFRTLHERYLAAVREEIERHGGIVERFVGAATMALFGAVGCQNWRPACKSRISRCAHRVLAPHT